MHICCQSWQHLQKKKTIYIYLQTASNIEVRVLPEELHLQHNAIYFVIEQSSHSVAAKARGWHVE